MSSLHHVILLDIYVQFFIINILILTKVKRISSSRNVFRGHSSDLNLKSNQLILESKQTFVPYLKTIPAGFKHVDLMSSLTKTDQMWSLTAVLQHL